MNTCIVIGTLLGDAWIQQFPNKTGSYRFAFSQVNKDYALWKADQLGLPFTFKDRRRLDPRTEKIYSSCEVYIKMDKDYKKQLHNMFYTPKKEVSDKILEQVTDIALAIWYMDDGNMYYNGNNCHINLAIQGFNDESKVRIINWFENKYGLHFKRTGNSIRITSRRECEKFMLLVEKYIPECMSYKKLSSALVKYDKTLTDEQRKCRNKKYW